MAVEIFACDVSSDADDRPDGEVDVAGEDHERLAGREYRGDRDARGDPVEEAAADVVVDQQTEDEDRHRHDGEERQLPEAFGPETQKAAHSAPIAAVMTVSSVASPRSKRPICRPSRMTRTRSLMASTSGRSEEIRM